MRSAMTGRAPLEDRIAIRDRIEGLAWSASNTLLTLAPPEPLG
jgi:hypothetical protein